MKYLFDEHNYTIRFEKDELIAEGLKEFIKTHNIRGGWIVGLGGLQWAELGFYDMTAQEYAWTKFDEPLELSNVTGNIAWQDDEPVLHLHATVSDTSLRAHAGHIKEAKTAGTVEIYIRMWPLDEGFTRVKDADTGLNLLNL